MAQSLLDSRWALAVVVVLGCGAPGCLVPGALVRHSADAPHAPDEPDMRVLTHAQALAAGLEGQSLVLAALDSETDGERILGAWMDRARPRSHQVGDVSLYLVRARPEGAVQCRIDFFPQDSVEEVVTPGHSVAKPTTRWVMRPVTTTEQRCQLVSRSQTHTETTYHSQYNSFTKSTTSVPQTRTVTTSQMVNECHPVTVSKLVSQTQTGTEWSFVPPQVTMLHRMKLRESEAACEDAPEGARSRAEGLVYTSRAAEAASR